MLVEAPSLRSRMARRRVSTQRAEPLLRSGTMSGPSHYTKKPVERSQQKRQTQNEEGARARLVDALETHYEKTWTLELCCREGLDWRAMYQLDVMHEDPDPNLTDEARELETPRAQKILELVEDAVSTLELEASVDGASRVCVRGWPERR